MNTSERLTEVLAIVGRLAPVSQAAGTVYTDEINLVSIQNGQLLFEVSVGAQSGSVDFVLQSSPTSGGAYVDIAGTAITAITGGQKIARVGVRMPQLGSVTPNQFIRGKLVVTTGPALVAVLVHAGDARYEPNSDNNIAAVVQSVNL